MHTEQTISEKISVFCCCFFFCEFYLFIFFLKNNLEWCNNTISDHVYLFLFHDDNDPKRIAILLLVNVMRLVKSCSVTVFIIPTIFLAAFIFFSANGFIVTPYVWHFTPAPAINILRRIPDVHISCKKHSKTQTCLYFTKNISFFIFYAIALDHCAEFMDIFSLAKSV